MTKKTTLDPVNKPLVELEDAIGLQPLGIMNNQVWHHDPKRLVFTLARYKFVAKMLTGKERVAEVGCGDGFAARIVKQEVGYLLISDVDPLFVNNFRQPDQQSTSWRIEATVHNILEKPLPSPQFDAVYSLDVLEHISSIEEDAFMEHVCDSLGDQGVGIIGMPSLESQQYASPPSKAGHINCKTGQDFSDLMNKYFHNVFLFSMNDELVHTGFSKMAHYLIAIGCAKR